LPTPFFASLTCITRVLGPRAAGAPPAPRLGAEFVASLTNGVGQLCTSPGLIFVADGPGTDDFVDAATAAVAATSGAPMLNAGIAAAFTAGVRRLAATEAVWTAAKGSDAGAACTGVPQLFVTTGERFLADRELHEEVFGPASIIVRVTGAEQFATLVDELEGQLTATVHAVAADRELAATLLGKLELIAGRVLFDGWPTGVEVGHAVVHGGPFPATSAPSTTSVGSRAIERFLRPVAYQNVPDDLLADEIRADNPLGIWRRVDGVITRD
ncbi:aldehyde dehydrogenase (NADP(+)), partial [Nocardia sp. NPDC004718]